MKRFYVFLTLLLAIVLLPMALDYRKTQMQVAQMLVPEPPPMAEMPDYINVLDQAPEPVMIGRHSTEPAGNDVDEISLKLDDKGLPVAWSLWLADFPDYDAAEALRNKLLEAGYRAYLDDLAAADQSLSYQVLVGPGFRPERLRELVPGLKKDFSLEPRLERYYP
ncbi:SPOR domain-containing protein [Spongorhabdus nitratireducens]